MTRLPSMLLSSKVNNALPFVHGFKSASSIAPAMVPNFPLARDLSSAAASQVPASDEDGTAPSAQPVARCFAIVEILGKQYKVTEGDRITTESMIGKIPGEDENFLTFFKGD